MGRPREFDKGETLIKAMDVFWQRGYSAAGMPELCAAMGINPGSLYAAYNGKHELFLAALKHYLSHVTQEGIKLIKSADTFSEGINNYFDYVLDGILTGRRCNGCFGTNSFLELCDHDDEVRELMSRHFSLLEKEFYEVLVRDGFRDAKAHASYLVCFAQGLNVMARTSPSQTSLRQSIETALKPFNQ